MPYILIKLVKKKTLKVQKNTNKPISAVKVTGYVRGQRIRYIKKKGGVTHVKIVWWHISARNMQTFG